MSNIRTRVRLLFSTLAQMTSANPVLLEGETWTEKDAGTGYSTGRRKVGDGVTAFTSLPFEPSSGGGGGGGSATDLSIANRGATTLDVASSTGADVTLPAATNTQAGLATAAQVAKLEGIAAGATANATDAQLRDRSTHTGTQSVATITGLGGAAVLNVGTGAGTVAAGDDARLGDAREWSATTISQAEAEAGTATTRRAFTAERVRQSIVAWWNGATSSFGRSWVAIADAAAGTDALNVFTSTLKGLVPASGGGTTSFLRADGTWAAPGGVGGGDALVANPLSQFAATTSAQLRGVITDETGTGALVFATSPTLVTPALGTPSSGTLTNCTGLPVAGITGWDAPPAIGGTTPAAGTFTALGATASLLLPGAAPSTPAAGHIYRVTDTLRYRDSGAAERLLLNAQDNLANLANAGTARSNLGLKSGALVAIHVGTTAPSSPSSGDLWVDTT